MVVDVFAPRDFTKRETFKKFSSLFGNDFDECFTPVYKNCGFLENLGIIQKEFQPKGISRGTTLKVVKSDPTALMHQCGELVVYANNFVKHMEIFQKYYIEPLLSDPIAIGFPNERFAKEHLPSVAQIIEKHKNFLEILRGANEPFEFAEAFTKEVAFR
jgi:hypothetical protein